MADAKVVIAVDESGRGSLAGPITVAAVAFRFNTPPTCAVYQGVRGSSVLVVKDSKKIKSQTQREVLAAAVTKEAIAVSVIERSSKEIDARLMFTVFPEAVQLAVARVMENVVRLGQFTNPSEFIVLIDGDLDIKFDLPCPVRYIVGGDALSWKIGAASIVAKVACDRRMDELHEKYPEYGFDKHRGYPTPQHKKLLKAMGPTPAHRHTFKPVADSKPLPPGFE